MKKFSKKGHMRKIVAGALVLAMSVGCLTACKSGDTADNSGKMTIKWMGMPYMTVDDDSAVQKYLEERYDVKLDLVGVSESSYKEKLGAMLATGDVPDVFFVQEPDVWQPLAKQSLISEIKIDEIKQYMPELYKAVEELEPKIWKAGMYEGVNYTIPRYNGREWNTAGIWRGDWLEKLGIEKAPETLEEYEEALLKIHTGDPDGNGKMDTYGFTAYDSSRLFDSFFGAFGIMPEMWREDDGVISNGTVHPRAKEALELLHKWYEMGIIDPEFITDGNEQMKNKFKSDKIGLLFSTANNWMDCTPSGNGTLSEWKVIKPEAYFTLSPIPEGPYGDRGDWLWGPRSNFIVFGKQLEDQPEKRAKIMTMLHDMISNEEVALRVVWGEEGKTYTYNDEEVGPESGLKYMEPYDSDSIARAGEGIGQGGFFNMAQPTDNWALASIADKYSPKELLEFNEANCHWNSVTDAIFRTQLPSNTIYGANLSKLKITNYAAFITGERSLDEWDAFVQEWKDAGGDKLTAEAQEVYDENYKD